jgi:hypothetical protein
MLTSCRLPFRYDPLRLEEDLRRIEPAEWVAHFNTLEYEGEWDAVALRSVGGAAAGIYPDPTSTAAFLDTPVLACCVYFHAIVAQFQCPVRAVRLLRLGPSARIREHRDFKLGYEDGDVRIHVPITTNADVDFVVNGDKVEMHAGECWYINFNLPHRVVNRGTTARVHLVIDCMVNDWLREQLGPEITNQPVETPAPEVEPVSRAPENLARFRALVLDDATLVEELCDIVDRPLFVERVVRLGTQRGCPFAPEDVEEELRAGRRAWLERRIR